MIRSFRHFVKVPITFSINELGFNQEQFTPKISIQSEICCYIHSKKICEGIIDPFQNGKWEISISGWAIITSWRFFLCCCDLKMENCRNVVEIHRDFGVSAGCLFIYHQDHWEISVLWPVTIALQIHGFFFVIHYQFFCHFPLSIRTMALSVCQFFLLCRNWYPWKASYPQHRYFHDLSWASLTAKNLIRCQRFHRICIRFSS